MTPQPKRARVTIQLTIVTAFAALTLMMSACPACPCCWPCFAPCGFCGGATTGGDGDATDVADGLLEGLVSSVRDHRAEDELPPNVETAEAVSLEDERAAVAY